MTQRPAAVVVLAAGEGTRMKSSTPKVLHELAGRTLVGHAVAAAQSLEPDHLTVVVGHGRDQVAAHIADVAPTVTTAVQEEQLGTGHAVQCALETLPELTGVVVVTYGDVPLLSTDTLRALIEQHLADGNGATVLTAELDDPSGYGRIVRGDDGAVHGIVEHKDADDATLRINEINSGIYAFDAEVLRAGLSRLTTDNAQGELYLTDVLGFARGDGRRVGALVTDDVWQTEGVNDRVQLAALHRELNRRITTRWMRAGVTIVDPATTWIDVTVTLGRDVTVRPGVQLHGATSIGEGAQIGPDSTLRDTTVGPGAEVVRTHAIGAEIGARATVGPFSYLRAGTRLGEKGKIGGFVETKKAEIGEGSKVPHLSYVGDATIGDGVNIGAGTIVANYDGVDKHQTTIGDHTFVGSDSVLVAPVELADGSYVAAGSTVTSRTEPGELAVARARQRNIPGWVERKRPGTATDEAARRANARQTKDDARVEGSDQ
ncbi:bifunctional UDP-N-acetylglucosamine diphosphorylase/glucosamine-1-phosphate N-acetyltransferase GlmU [Phytoactinopolyspora halotolerans]|uniref:Bifunctional protein GlmU n=1 Tax=Phytoactinopolyspora halotolerans TaxID=1981512 RepID=A0A6L9S3F3_9ACTN|nr:bifunctional UDP-N-acetylglucosamine diphosphorylase/glucosamine-1-phosphate N-acetyltransferase GlmU [Phytoactinopolyspora halotolerans]NED99582.1 bifunctional UDP-N-acetylglucosamine diphosphorylase/glucosamine-1-phosphate N-acetyltransferase GlmU [Phytoactinopolyspora halotolerans]